MIKAHFNSGDICIGAYGLWQWDYGQVLSVTGLNLPAVIEMHFDNGTEKSKIFGETVSGVTFAGIPDKFLQSADPINVYVYVNDGDHGKTLRQIVMHVQEREKPGDYDPSNAQELMGRILEQIKECVTEAKGYRDDAAEEADRAEAAAKLATDAINGIPGVVEQAKSEIDDYAQKVKTDALSAIDTTKDTALDEIQNETTASVETVTSEGGKQVQNVSAKGKEILDSMPPDFTQIQSEVSSLKKTLVKYDNLIINKVDYDKFSSQSTSLTYGDVTIGEKSVSEKITASYSYGNLHYVTPIISAENKQIYVKAKVKVDNDVCSYVSVKCEGTSGGAIAGAGTLRKTSPVANTEYTLYGIFTLTSSLSGNVRLDFEQSYNSKEDSLGKSVTYSDIMIFDIAELFNETVTTGNIDEFINQCGGYVDTTLTFAEFKEIVSNIAETKSTEVISSAVDSIGLVCKNVNTNIWSSGQEMLDISKNSVIATLKSSTYGDLKQITNIPCENGRIVYVSAQVKTNYDNCSKISVKYYGSTSGGVAGVGTLLQNSPTPNTEYTLHGYITIPSNFVGNLTIRIVQEYSVVSAGAVMTCDNIMVIDVTDMFGKAFEPNVDEFEYLLSKIGGYIEDVESVYSTKDVYLEKEMLKNKVNINSMPFIMPSITRAQRPIMTLTYDDCSNTIYDYAFPIHKEKNVPATFYVVPSFIGSGKLQEYGMAEEWDRLVEMDKSKVGHIKIECHSYGHNNLPLLNETQLAENFEKSISLFAQHGIDVNHISYPGGYYNDVVQMVAQEYFQSGRTTGGNYVDPIINGYDVAPYAIGSYSFDNRNIKWLKTRIDDAFANNKWLSIFLHSIHPDGQVESTLEGGTRTCMTPTELAEVIDYAKTKGVDVVSLEEALRTFAPIYYWCDRNANAPMVIQRNGEIKNNVQGQEPYTFN